MTEVLHTADTHVGYRQYNSPARRGDFLAAFERVVDDAVERDVDAVVHAGDVFHDRRPSLEDLLGTVEALRTLADAGVPFLAIVGNHEDKREAQWLDLFERMDLATRLDAAGTTVGGVTFYGLDYVPPSRRDDLDYEFAPPDGDRTALVAHGQFDPLAPSIHGNAWDVETVIRESTVDFDAVLLGDEHEPGQARVADTWVTYSGSTERTSASERDDRGYNLVSFDDGVDIRRRGLPTREFAFVDVELRDGEGVERVRERVREYDLTDAVCIVTIEGEGDPVTPAAVEEGAREAGAVVARVNDRRDLDDEEGELDVSFADPDEAVRERVRDLGLSGAAREVDETVRASELADSNVRGAVEDRVRELLEDDPGAFEPADDAHAETTDDGEAENPDGREEVDDPETAEPEDADAEEPDGDEAENAADGEETEDADQTGATDDDGQASMEEYL